MNLKTAHATLTLASAVFLFACKKKELPLGYTGSVQFYCKGTINNDSLVMEAGKKSAYMFTYILDKGLIPAGFSGELQAPGNGGLRFTFYDASMRDGMSEAEASQFFTEGNRAFRYVFEDSLAGFTALQLYNYAPPPAVTQAVQWVLPGMFPAYGPYVNAILAPTGTFELRCFTQAGSAMDSLRNTIVVNENGIVCPMQFHYIKTSSLTYHFTAEGNFDAYIWNFPGAQTATGPEADWTAPAEGIYEIALTGSSSSGCTRTWKRHLCTSVLANGGVSADFYFTDTNHVADQIAFYDAFNSVEIAWEKEDASGIKTRYKSLKSFNTFPGDQFFTILQSGKYRTNAEGIPTWWIRAQTTCWLYNETNRLDSVLFRSDSLRIAVGVYTE